MNFAKYILGAIILIIAWVLCVIKIYTATQNEGKVGTILYEVENQLGFDRFYPNKGDRDGSEKGYPMGDNAVLASVESGGVFYQAGFRHSDETPQATMDFFEQILFNQGKQISIPIIRDGHSMVILVDIPQLELSYDPCDFKAFECTRQDSGL